MQTETRMSEKSSETAKGSPSIKDPVVLGVSLPLTATVAAAAQLKDVWGDALQALLSAAKEKANAAKARSSGSNTDV